jgi:hypothetical protein
LAAALPADCTVCVTAVPTGAGSCDVTDVAASVTVSTGVGRGAGRGLGLGEGLGDEDTGSGLDGDPEPAPSDIGRVATPPGAIVPPADARPVEGAREPDLGAAGAARPRALPPPDSGRLATVRATGAKAIAAPVVWPPAPPSASDPALGAGGPEKTWPSTPSWLKPPPRASVTSAAIIADGTISAALEAASS